MHIAFLYEHPQWSQALIECLRENHHEVTPIRVSGLQFDPDELPGRYDLAVNRINIMPSVDAAPGTTFQAMHLLASFETGGTRVVNGAHSHMIGLSKAMQNALFNALKLKHPRAIAIHRAEDAPAAAERIGFPLVFKPNVGGSGQGIQKFVDAEEIEMAVKTKSLDFGIDSTGLIQEYVESDGFVYRVEILGDELFYSIRQPMQEGSFNYCAADGCSTDDAADSSAASDEMDFCVTNAGSAIQTFEPAAGIVDQVRSIVRKARADVGGVEYFVERQTGQACFYDFNPYSNFVSNGEALLGFSPEQRFNDFLSSLVDDSRNSS